MKNIYIIVLIGVLVIGAGVFLFQNDEKYLKKSTIKLLHLMSPSPTALSNTALFRKIHEIAKYTHFSVEYSAQTEQYLYKDRSLANLRSTLAAYFKQPDKNWRINIPSFKELNVSLSKSEEKQTGEVTFSLKATQGQKNISCSVLVYWEKEKKWLIHKVTISSCSSSSP